MITSSSRNTTAPQRKGNFTMPAEPMNREQRAARRKAVAHAIKAGRTIPDVAKEFHVSRTTILNSCAEHGVTVGREQDRQNPRAKPGDQFLQIVAWLIEGYGVAEIAEDAGVTKQYVHLVRHRAAGIFDSIESLGKAVPESQRPNPLKMTDKQKFKVLRFLLDGRFTYEEIGEKVGLHKATVSELAKVAKKIGLMKFSVTDRTRNR